MVRISLSSWAIANMAEGELGECSPIEGCGGSSSFLVGKVGTVPMGSTLETLGATVSGTSTSMPNFGSSLLPLLGDRSALGGLTTGW